MVGISTVLVSLSLIAPFSYAYPDLAARDDSSPQGGMKIVLPPRSNDTGLKQIPGRLPVDFVVKTILTRLRNIDSAHPFRAPGPNDQRGPCRGSPHT